MIILSHPADCELCYGTMVVLRETGVTDIGREYEISYPCPNVRIMGGCSHKPGDSDRPGPCVRFVEKEKK